MIYNKKQKGKSMVVNNVSFTGLKQTKNGNIYEKKNTSKRIGTVVGLAGGVAAATLSPQVISNSIIASIKLLQKGLPIGPKTILGAGILATTLLGRGLGSIPDFFINKKRKAKADKLAAEKQ